jgi:hypothetical protein
MRFLNPTSLRPLDVVWINGLLTNEPLARGEWQFCHVMADGNYRFKKGNDNITFSHTFLMSVPEAYVKRYIEQPSLIDFEFNSEDFEIELPTLGAGTHACVKGQTPIDGQWVCKTCGKDMGKVGY